MSIEHTPTHPRKAYTMKRAKVDGTRFGKRDDQAAYLEHCAPST